MTDDERLRYPIGRFRFEAAAAAAERAGWIDAIAALPARLRAACDALDERAWQTPYRAGGWTPRQVVHHVADSHLNAYVRFKLALTEPNPTIKPYDEAAWAELPDVALAPPEVSLALVEALHRRWAELLGALQPADFARTVYHPERQRTMSLDELLALYAWHGRHHVAHVESVAVHG